MTQATLVLLILAGTVALFASDRLRVDVVALLSLLALVATGTLSTAEALSGLAAPIVVMIGALFVVGEGLTNTGIAARVAAAVAAIGRRNERLLLPSIMTLSALLSALMSSTGTVAVMLPVVIGLARALDRPLSGLLLPMAFAAQLGGVLTLIGTPPNLIVSQALGNATGTGLTFFSLTPYGLVGLVAGITLMVVAGRMLLPAGKGGTQLAEEPSLEELARLFGLAPRVAVCRLPANSPFAGRSASAVGARRNYGVSLLSQVKDAAEPWGRPRAYAVEPHSRLSAGDRLLAKGTKEALAEFVAAGGLEAHPFEPRREAERVILELGVVEVLLTPQSRLIGRTVRESGVRERFGVNVVAVRRRGKAIDRPVSTIRLDFGDSLLVVGSWNRIEELRRDRRNLIVASEPRTEPDRLPGAARAPWAVAVLAAMLALMVFSEVPLVWSAVGAALAMILGGAVEPGSVYRVIQWPSLVMIAAMLPVATALGNSGALDLLVGSASSALAGAPVVVALLGLMLATSLLSQVISNTATAVLLAPVAIEMASRLGVAAEPLLIGVAIAASTAFATPVASPVNALVLGPGGYRFGDFFKAGVALQATVLLLSAGLILVLAL
ncbi:MAG: SLC13 family permease [bacterium]|nr:SLC13 family permease [bacterium]